ncbi:triple tyrosine motif-containing protein [Halalkalibacter akibai]|uniref:L,D-TPase catalytic domain-containing protein n=1 Tax=Halalkalibacter akibai (strain ATCC 43226 / DSM 21942 / CIP 109018 / JCM 9157 / 1139) TaxID=1236973 RepID=W4QT66_HALA3|nr:hypothetical protein JCM9157_1560 [Halalkalibacter akibai JCM 9157]
MKKLTVLLILVFSTFFLFSQPTFANSSNQLIIINKASNQLAYYNNGKIVKTFKVATGRQSGYTPEGTFKIVNKIKNRPYYKANIAGGATNNPLGDRWLGLNARGTNGTTYAIHGNNNANSIGTYASAGCVRMHNDEIRWLFDQVPVNTTVIITNTSKTFDSIAASHGYNVGSKLNNVTTSVKSPQPTNTSVKFTATTSAGKDPLFKYSVYDGKKWTTIQNYSTSKSVNWKPTKAGSYKIKAQVKSRNSKKAFDDEKVFNYTVFSPASVKNVATSVSSPQPTNKNISISATSNSSQNNEYKFSIYDGEKWKTIQGYSSNAKVNWKPTKEGSYKIKVQARHKLSKKKFDSEKTMKYTVYAPAKVTSFKTNLASPSPSDATVQLTAQSNNNKNNLFKFLVHDGSKWKTVQDFSSNSTFNWKQMNEGSYKLKVQVKHKSSTKSFDHEKELNYVIFKKATIDSIQTNKVSPQFTKTNIVISTPSNNKDHLYRFRIHNGTEWKTVQDFSNKSTYDWKPEYGGQYILKIEVKHKFSKEKFDASQELKYIINSPVTLTDIAPANLVHQPGMMLTVSATATGGSELMYKFEILDGSTWRTLQDYSSSNSVVWETPKEEGDYTIRVLVKSKNSPDFEATLEQTYTIKEIDE